MSTNEAVDTEALDRRTALATSGWGTTFRFVQPRNLAFWTYLLLALVGVAIFVVAISGALGRAPADAAPALVRTVVLAVVVYGVVLWWFFRTVDRYTRQSRKLIVTAFLWGGLAATGIAGLGNAGLELWNRLFGQAFAADWGAALTAPLVEEFTKGLGLILLIALAARQITSALDGFVLGAFIGLGFQLFEDILYGVQSATAGFGLDPIGSATHTLLWRFGAGISGHVVYSAIFCTGLVFWLGRPGEPRNRGRGALLILLALGLHGFWDALDGIFGTLTSNDVTMLMIAVPIILFRLAVAAWVYLQAAPNERAVVRAVLAPEVTHGVLTDEELHAAVEGRRARRAYLKVATNSADKKRRTFLLEAASDLANELADSGAENSPRVDFARQETRRFTAVGPENAAAQAART